MKPTTGVVRKVKKAIRVILVRKEKKETKANEDFKACKALKVTMAYLRR